MSNEYAISLKTNRLVKKSTANYRKLQKLNLIKEIDVKEQPTHTEQPSPPQPEKTLAAEPDVPEFSEHDLQHKMAELTTNMVADNMKQIIKSQKLNDSEYSSLLRRMLYNKLCMEEPKEPKKKEKVAKKPVKKAKKKFKVVVPSSESESESESD
jgi:hypothetical protein